MRSYWASQITTAIYTDEVVSVARSGFNPHLGHVAASLDKTLYDDYLCLVASNKQQI